MKRYFLTISIILCAVAANAQFTTAGKIEYERKVNIYAQMKEMEEDGPNPFLEQMKSKIPKFNSSFFDLIFDTSRSIYKPGKEVEGNNAFKMFGGGPATANIVMTDFTAKTVKANKKVFEQKCFVIQRHLQIFVLQEY